MKDIRWDTKVNDIVIADGEMDLGQFGYVYFIDWDQVRARPRQVQVQIIGE